MVASAQFEISIDGLPAYLSRPEGPRFLSAAQMLKSRNPNSVVKLKDLESGEEIIIAFKSAQP